MQSQIPLFQKLFLLLILLPALPCSAAEKITYFYTDIVGSPISAFEHQAAKEVWQEHHRPYGKRVRQEAGGNSGTFPVRYTGHYEDNETGLVYMGARYYHPEVRRFFSIDPVGFTGSEHSFNRYAYAANNPYRYIDPTGLTPELHGSFGQWNSSGTLFGQSLTAGPSGGTSFTSEQDVEAFWGVVNAIDTIDTFFDFTIPIKGLAKGGARFLYRVIRPDENPAKGLFPRNPNATYLPEGHIVNGSRRDFKGSQYISTTTDPRVAEKWAEKTGNRIVEIQRDRVQGTIIDLSTDRGRSAHLRGTTARNFARSSSEVLIDGMVPAQAIRPYRR